MKIMIDTTKQLQQDRTTIIVNSKGRHMPYDFDDEVEVRAEWLYSMMVDMKVDLLVVENKEVAGRLREFGADVVSYV